MTFIIFRNNVQKQIILRNGDLDTAKSNHNFFADTPFQSWGILSSAQIQNWEIFTRANKL